MSAASTCPLDASTGCQNQRVKKGVCLRGRPSTASGRTLKTVCMQGVGQYGERGRYPVGNDCPGGE